ncbi:MAG TPA: hypothetical protein VMM12_09095 [Longimicrobiales bacterium]|nr:hypothetical protein [Longimicrobiales bacterium]
MWEQTWVLPVEGFVLGVEDVLPAGVALSADGSELVATVAGVDLDLSLAAMCPACIPLDGSTAPKPAFSYTTATTTSLPADLVSASLSGGELALRLAHSLSFDPLRPASDPAAERGFLIVEITSGSAVVARDSISGDDVAFDASTVLQPILLIRTVEATGAVEIEVMIHSPAGDSTQVDTADTLGLRLFPSTVTLSQATVQAGAIAVNALAAEMDLSGFDSVLVARVQRGALRLDVTNPFGIEGTVDLVFDFGGTAIRKSMALASGPSTITVAFTGTELRDMLAAGSVAVSAQGTLAAPDGTMTVRPTDALVMESMVELVILVGGGEGGT